MNVWLPIVQPAQFFNFISFLSYCNVPTIYCNNIRSRTFWKGRFSIELFERGYINIATKILILGFVEIYGL